MADPITKLIRFKNYIPFTANDVKDEVNDLIFEFKNIPEFYTDTAKYDDTLGNNLAILCPGNYTYTLNNGNYFCNLFLNIDDADKTNINNNADKKSFIYKYTNPIKPKYGQYLIYISEFIITDLLDNNNKINMVKLGIEVGLLISLYNLANIGNEIKNIRLPGIGTVYTTPNERYYLNYFRDMFLHSMVAVLKQKNILKDIESIQFCNQETNQYDIYGSKLIFENFKDFNEIYSKCIKYYLYNGNHYLDKFQDINTITLDTTNPNPNFFFLNTNINLKVGIPINDFDITIEKIYNDIILDPTKKNDWLSIIDIDKLYTDNKNDGNNAELTTLNDNINSCFDIGNLCWLNSANQFILSITEVGNFFIDYINLYINEKSDRKIFFTNMKSMLNCYKNTFTGTSIDKQKNINHAIRNLLDIDIFNSSILSKFNLGQQLEAMQYIELILGIDISNKDSYNNDIDFYKLLVTKISSIETRFYSMYYQKLKHKSVTFTGTITNYKFIGILQILQFLANIKPNQNIITAETSSHTAFKNSYYPYLITQKYFIIQYIASQYIRFNECYHKVELINGKKYICKALLVKSGIDGNGHYICYKLNKDDNNKYDIYDDLKKNISSKNVIGHLIETTPYIIECALYEQIADGILIDNNNKKNPFDALKKEVFNSDYVIHFKDIDQEQNDYNNINTKDYKLYNIVTSHIPLPPPITDPTDILQTLQNEKQNLIDKINKQKNENLKLLLQGKNIDKIDNTNEKILANIEKTEQLINQINYEQSKPKSNNEIVQKLVQQLNSIKTTIPNNISQIINPINNVNKTTDLIHQINQTNAINFNNYSSLIPYFKKYNNLNDSEPAIYAQKYILGHTQIVDKKLENYEPVDLIPYAILETLVKLKNKQNKMVPIYFD